MTKETFSTVKDIFSAGKWNGDEYTEIDIDEMIKNFEKLSSENSNFKVPLKIDFFKDVKDPKTSHGGQPAVGWISKLTKQGKKLFAQIDNIPEKIKELIDNKAYRQVSAEIMFNMKNGEERLRRVLTGVALLGVETPGVSNLDEFSAFYNLEYNDAEETKKYIIYNEEESTMTQEEIKKLQDENAKLQEEKIALEKSVTEQKEFTAKLEAEKKAIDEKIAIDLKAKQDAEIEQKKVEFKAFIEAKKSEGKVLPAHEEKLVQIYESLEDSKTVKFTNAEGKEDSISIRKVFQSFIDSLPKLIDLNEKSMKADEELKEFVAKPEEEAGSIESQKLDAKARMYMEKNKECSYKEALIAVSKQNKGE